MWFSSVKNCAINGLKVCSINCGVVRGPDCMCMNAKLKCAQDACGAQVPKLRGEQKYAAFTAIASAALPFKTEQHRSRDMFGSLFSLL